MSEDQSTISTNGREIEIHDSQDCVAMRRAGLLAAEVLDFITPHVQVGTTTDQLDTLCHDYIVNHGATPAPLNYRGFPKSICTSINHVVCHGIPGKKKLAAGDILNIDVTVIVDGWHGDSSRMFCIGKVPRKAARLVEVTYEAMMLGISKVRPGATLGDIGHAIQTFAEEQRCSVVRDFCGHGIGTIFHKPPNVLQYGKKNSFFSNLNFYMETERIVFEEDGSTKTFLCGMDMKQKHRITYSEFKSALWLQEIND